MPSILWLGWEKSAILDARTHHHHADGRPAMVPANNAKLNIMILFVNNSVPKTLKAETRQRLVRPGLCDTILRVQRSISHNLYALMRWLGLEVTHLHPSHTHPVLRTTRPLSTKSPGFSLGGLTAGRESFSISLRTPCNAILSYSFFFFLIFFFFSFFNLPYLHNL